MAATLQMIFSNSISWMKIVILYIYYQVLNQQPAAMV